VGRVYEQNFAMHGYGVFVAFSVAAIVLGAITRSSAIGKTALITSSILLIGSIGILG
jgi:heme exporter protein D